MLLAARRCHLHLPKFPFSPKKHRSIVTPILDSPIHQKLHHDLREIEAVVLSTPTLPLSVIFNLLNLLRDTVSSGEAIFSDPKFPSDPDALESHLVATVPLLDACNAISAEIALISRSLLPLRLALHLLSKPDALHRVKNALDDFDRCPRGKIRLQTANIVSKLVDSPARGGISAAATTAYAVEAVSRLVAVATISALAGEDLGVFGCSVAGEWRWVEAFEGLRISVCGRLGKGFSGDMAALEEAVAKLKSAVDGRDDVSIRDAAAETERLTTKMVEDLDRLSDDVNAVFRSVISLRNTALDCLRHGMF